MVLKWASPTTLQVFIYFFVICKSSLVTPEILNQIKGEYFLVVSYKHDEYSLIPKSCSSFHFSLNKNFRIAGIVMVFCIMREGKK